MSKRTPGSKYAMKLGRERYRKERERARQRRANKAAQAEASASRDAKSTAEARPLGHDEDAFVVAEGPQEVAE